MKLTFKDEDLRRILAQHARDTLKLEITESEIFSFYYEVDDDDEVTGVSIEFEAPKKPV